MNVGLYDCRVDTKFLPIFQARSTAACHDQLIDGLQRSVELAG